ncbi:MAG TPA: HEPN domain-containing protein [Gemmataceae bacterium]|nr:HEPN domain-containing protein [Gemmataceae bacterium]
MNQADLQKMADERILDAKVLLDGGRWEFAYYAAGYAIECALKSCLLARMIYTGWVFQEKIKPDECLTHDFGKLVQLAGLTDELNNKLKASAAAGGPAGAAFAKHWTIVILWKVTSRYEAKTQLEAEILYNAITHDPDGVLRWIKNYW